MQDVSLRVSSLVEISRLDFRRSVLKSLRPDRFQSVWYGCSCCMDALMLVLLSDPHNVSSWKVKAKHSIKGFFFTLHFGHFMERYTGAASYCFQCQWRHLIGCTLLDARRKVCSTKDLEVLPRLTFEINSMGFVTRSICCFWLLIGFCFPKLCDRLHHSGSLRWGLIPLHL